MSTRTLLVSSLSVVSDPPINALRLARRSTLRYGSSKGGPPR